MNRGGWFKYPLVPPTILNVYKQKTPLLGGDIQVTKNTMKNLLQPYVKINQPVVLMKILIAFHI